MRTRRTKTTREEGFNGNYFGGKGRGEKKSDSSPLLISDHPASAHTPFFLFSSSSGGYVTPGFGIWGGYFFSSVSWVNVWGGFFSSCMTIYDCDDDALKYFRTKISFAGRVMDARARGGLWFFSLSFSHSLARFVF